MNGSSCQLQKLGLEDLENLSSSSEPAAEPEPAGEPGASESVKKAVECKALVLFQPEAPVVNRTIPQSKPTNQYNHRVQPSWPIQTFLTDPFRRQALFIKNVLDQRAHHHLWSSSHR